MTTQEISLSLNIRLLKEANVLPDDYLRTERRGELTESTVELEGVELGKLWVARTRQARPPWAKFFSPAGSGLVGALMGASNAAVYVVEVEGRLFALSFGYGRGLLEPDAVVSDFGLKVTLNSIDPLSLRSVDRTVIDSLAISVREQSSRETGAGSFGINMDRDLLRAITGTPRDARLGLRLSGKDALAVTTKVSLESLNELLKLCLEQYESEEYKADFGWVDNIQEVSDSDLITQLEAQLVEAIQEESHTENLWLAAPDILEWFRIEGFKFSKSNRADIFHDIHLSDFKDCLRNPNDLSLESLRSRRVYCISRETGVAFMDWPVFRCVAFETQLEDKTYILNEGRWYQIAVGYVEQVDQFMETIQASEVVLPDYDHAGEAAYNIACSASLEECALMDRKNISYGGGYSKVEFCDLLTAKKQMIHVKRYSGSSTLSHLFQQGLVAAEAFLFDPQFRELVNEELPATHQYPDTNLQPIATEYEVVYAITSWVEGNLRLPFFSKVSMRNVVRRLRALGFEVRLNKIQDTSSR